jgi:hypothetical protein
MTTNDRLRGWPLVLAWAAIILVPWSLIAWAAWWLL